MSEIKVNSIKGVGASTAAITVNNTDGTCTANITNNLSNRNLVQNGAFQIVQRASSSTTSGYGSVDRWQGQHSSTGVTVTHSQQSTSSSDAPYQNGFQNFFRLALSGAGTANNGAYLEMQHRIEAQNIANSGWNFKSSSSNITLSFWVRPSTNQTFYCYLRTSDGTAQHYAFSFTASGNNTWTKITKTITGNTNLQFDNNNGEGFALVITPFYGTSYTNNLTLNQWTGIDNSNYLPDMASTWLTAGASTFDVTGVQLEVGSVATDFEHRSFAQELALCQRYFQRFATGDGTNIGIGFYYTSSQLIMVLDYIVQMRTTPTFSMISGTHYYVIYANGVADTFNSFTISSGVGSDLRCEIYNNSEISGTSGSAGVVRCNNAAPNGGQIDLSAEL